MDDTMRFGKGQIDLKQGEALKEEHAALILIFPAARPQEPYAAARACAATEKEAHGGCLS